MTHFEGQVCQLKKELAAAQQKAEHWHRKLNEVCVKMVELPRQCDRLRQQIGRAG
jgi:chromosome segregation ATPase